MRNIKTIPLKSSKEIIEIAKKVIQKQSEAIAHLSVLLDSQFSEAVTAVYQSPGRLIVTGIGKSAIIANKVVATLNSTGQPSMFMHAADAIHGDLGMIQSNDIVLCISKSGNTPEIKVLVPLVKKMGNQLIGMTSNKESFLAQKADFVFHAYVEKEACPNNLAPTTSTTAQLVLGDALAVSLLEMRQFSSSDFAKYHPGGALGKKLYLRVEDLIHSEKPQVAPDASLQEVIIEISSKRLGATVVTEEEQVKGLITDGDLRRMLQKGVPLEGTLASDIMSQQPKAVSKQSLAAEALSIMEANEITQLVVEDEGAYVGMVHLHDILKEGIL